MKGTGSSRRSVQGRSPGRQRMKSRSAAQRGGGQGSDRSYGKDEPFVADDRREVPTPRDPRHIGRRGGRQVMACVRRVRLDRAGFVSA